ncbi:MAG: hypothetical protein WC296_00090 [Candidatus Izemoplasmatales bacterium]|jgi:hypothetical protein
MKTGDKMVNSAPFSSLSDKSASAYNSIGTEREKTLHRTIKYYLCSDETTHEFKIGNYIVDIFHDGAIIEIQTGSFLPLKNKLTALLPKYHVTVVYPVINRKTIYLIDEMGVLLPKRSSPKKGQPLAIGQQLAQIRDLLGHPNLDFIIFIVDVDEYRTKTIVASKRKPYDRIDQYPKGIPTIYYLKTNKDYLDLLPKELTNPFTKEIFQKITHLKPSAATGVLLTYRILGIIVQTGKIGRAFVYEVVKNK